MVVRVGGDVWIGAARAVIETCVQFIKACNIRGYCSVLVAGLREIVREAGAGGEVGCGNFRGECLGSADGSDPGAALDVGQRVSIR